MPTEKFLDLSITRLSDGGLDVEQHIGTGESNRIIFHPAQVRLLAERAGLLKRTPEDALLKSLFVQLKARRDRVIELAVDQGNSVEIFDLCLGAFEIAFEMGVLLELANANADEPGDDTSGCLGIPGDLRQWLDAARQRVDALRVLLPRSPLSPSAAGELADLICQRLRRGHPLPLGPT